MDLQNEPLQPTKVLWDGDCAFCARAAGHVERSDAKHELALAPLQSAEPGFEPRALVVIEPDGTRLEGGRAALAVLEHLGRFRLFTSVAKRRPFIWIVEFGYQRIANHRQLISRLVTR